LLVGQFTFSFSGAYDEEVNFTKSFNINAETRYEDPNWIKEEYRDKRIKMIIDESVSKGFLTLSQKAYLNQIVDEYVKMFTESTEYVYQTEDKIPEYYKEGIEKYLHRSNPTGPDYRMFKDGKQIFICYSIDQIESAIELMTYGFLNENDELMNLNGIPKKSDGVIMAVKIFGGEEEALKGDIKSPYIDVPEYAKGYVAYADKVGLLNPVPDGTEWVDSELTMKEYGAMLMRVLGHKVIKAEYLGGGEFLVGDKRIRQEDIDFKSIDNAYLDLPSMSPRFGTAYNSLHTINQLQAGEPLRNGDLVSMAHGVLYELKYNSNVRLIDELSKKNFISKELRQYIENKKYYEEFTDVAGNRPDDVSDFTKLLYAYEMDDSDVRFDSIIANYYNFYEKKENQIARLSIYNVYGSLEESKNTALNILTDFGLPLDKSKIYIDRLVKNEGENFEIEFTNLKIKGKYFNKLMTFDMIVN